MWRLMIWIVAAAVGISTTHHLIWSNVRLHYPLRLLTVHVTAAFVLRAIWMLGVWWRQDQSNDTRNRKSRSLETRFQDAVFVVAANTTLGFSYKALLDMGSISTIAMALTMPLPLEHIVAQLLHDREGLRSTAFVRCCQGTIVTCCFAAIILADHHLHGLGLIWTLSAVASAMIARVSSESISQRAIAPSQSESLDGREPDRRTLLALTVGAPVALLLAIFGEDDNTGRCFVTACRIPWLMSLNIVSSALALSMCSSIFGNLPPSSDVEDGTYRSPTTDHSGAHCQILSSVTLSGLVVAGTHMAGSDTGLTLAQIVAYVVAMVIQLVPLDAGSNSKLLRDDSLTRSLRDSTDGDQDDLVEKVHPPRVLAREDSPKSAATLRAITYVVLTTAVLISVTLLWPRRLDPASTRSADVIRGSGSLDIVISRYQEPYSGVASLLENIRDIPSIAALNSTRVFVYDKAPGSNSTSSLELETSIYHQTFQISRIARPNVGREGETYLHHIMTHYHDLAQHTLFLQAEPHDLQHALRRLQDYFHRKLTGFMTLSYPSNVCTTCVNCVDFSEWEEDSIVLRCLQGAGFDSEQSCKDIHLTYHGQFVVSASRIRTNPPWFYTNILDQFVDPHSNMHKAPYLNQTWNKHIPDSLSAPVFGYTLERMWGSIFGCSGEKISVECPSLLSGTLGHKAATLDGCQCLDIDGEVPSGRWHIRGLESGM